MSNYEPGTVAMVHAEYIEPQVRILCSTARGERRWWGAGGYVMDEDLTDVRPLVTLDPENREQVERLGSLFFGHFWGERINPHALDCLVRALREQTRPPKPEEPTGLGAVVEDAEGVRWVRIDALENPWATDAGISFEDWSVIDAVRVLSEGVRP